MVCICIIIFLYFSEALEHSEEDENVFEEGSGAKEWNRGLNGSEEMDLVLSEEEGAGEGLSDGKLVIPLGDDDLSPEERRAEQTKVQPSADQGGGEGVQKSEEESNFCEDTSKSIEGGVSSLSLEEDGNQSDCAPLRTEDKSDSESGSVEGAASDSPNCDKCTENDHPQSSPPDLDTASIDSQASSETDSEATVPSQNADDEASSDSATASGSSGDPRVHVHLDNFNTFQYWRPPLPKVDIDFDVINGAPANLHVVAKVGFSHLLCQR